MRPDLSLPIPAVPDLGRVHFIAIGGVGMSGIARILLARGVPVSGSDAQDGAAVAALRALGATVHVGHVAEHLADADTVVVSSAIRESNPELVAARARGLRVLHRSQALAALMADRRAAAVAGTHGKTTTTSMLAVAARAAGADPSFAIGGDLVDGGSNAHDGSGDVFVAEADESDGSFLIYAPVVSVITNVEPDHLDHYGTAEAVEAAFDAFADRVRPGGALVACADDPGAARVAARAAARRPDDLRVVTYGEHPDADVRLTDLDVTGPQARFRLLVADPAVGAAPARTVTLRVPARHNALNAAAAWTAGLALGLPAEALLAGLESFTGARRRFEAKGVAGGVAVYDDYSHHPTEVEAVIRAARSVAGTGRVLAVFQPHLYSRTRLFAAEFARALGLADQVMVLDVYGAREDPEPGVSGALIADQVPLDADRVSFVPALADAVAEVARRVRPGDVVLTVGAGDVTTLGPAVLAALQPVGSRA